MRKLLALFLAMVMTVGLFGCDASKGETIATTTTAPTTTVPATVPPTEPPADTEPATEPPTTPTEPPATEPTLDNTSLYGIDVTNMTAAEAKAAIQETIAAYQVTLTVNGRAFQFTGKTLSMALSEEAFDAWFALKIQGEQPATTGIITYNVNSAVSTVQDAFEEDAVNASVVYNKTTKKFSSKAHKDGVAADVAPAKSALISAVETLSPAVSARIQTTEVPAAIKESDSLVSGAIANANSYLNLKISYTYQADGIPTTTEAISVDDLASFITFDKNLSLEISSSGVKDYISRMSYRNGGIERKGFVTSRGTTISQTVDYYKAVLNQSAMYNDLVSCLNNKYSGSRTAPFLPAGITNMPYGGSYVEIDLDNQQLWVYRDGELKIHSLLVSGQVSNRNWTPAGVFSIYGKETCTYLVGPTWRSYVDYWMPFNGGIGLHDANWRSEFGGQIYMYNGSHGCINLPPKNAGIVYNNISIGTKVIVYGGAHTAGNLTQVLSGTTEYTLNTESSPFSLNIQAKYTGPTLTYSSSDTNVVTVDENGLVTVIGGGTAQITVTSSKMDILNSATLVIRITVEGDPFEPDPSEPDPSEPDPSEPDPSEPNPSEPDPSEPDPSEPDPSEPDPSESEPSESEPAEPNPSEPDSSEPESTEPEQPVIAEPPKEETAEQL